MAIGVIASRFGDTFDDPLITLRYAQNVVSGAGPVYNPGQPVEGFTSPLHLLVAVFVEMLPGGAKLLLLKLLSAVFACLLVHRALLLMRRIDLPDWARIFAIVLIGANWIIGQMGSDGLETTLSAWLLVWLFDLLVSKEAFRKPGRTAVIAGLVVAARPENLLIVIAFLLCALLFEREAGPLRRIAWGIGPLCTVIVITIGRRSYYGDWLPNTYYAKKLPIRESIHQGIEFLQWVASKQFGSRLDGMLPLALVIVILAGLAVAVFESRAKRNWAPALGYGAALVGANIVFVLGSGGGIASGGPRFLTPSVVPVALIVTMGITAIARSARFSRTTTIAVATAISAIALVPLLQTNSVAVLFDGVSDAQIIRHGGHLESRMWATLPSLTACAPAGSTIATTELGLTGSSRSDLRITDMRGLTNRSIAHDSDLGDRHVFGVFDPHWYESSSVVGRELIRTDPVLIVTFDPIPRGQSLLDGSYRHVATHVVDRFHIRSFARIDGPCDQ